MVWYLITVLSTIIQVELNQSDEFVIVACDGLWDVIDCAEAIRFTRAHLFKSVSIINSCNFDY